jgi:hypothetical protein
VSRSPEDALSEIARVLREGDTVISRYVVEPAAEPALGALCAAGPRAARAPGGYSFVVEAVREGFLLHYGDPRLLAGHDPDLALLAGDYLYALGIERLAVLGDSEALLELSDLIALAAESEAERGHDHSGPLWLAAAVAVGCGSTEAGEEAKRSARALEPGSAELLWEAASQRASASGLSGELRRAAETIELPRPRLADG